jgi:hypothetical protein
VFQVILKLHACRSYALDTGSALTPKCDLDLSTADLAFGVLNVCTKLCLNHSWNEQNIDRINLDGLTDGRMDAHKPKSGD